ncbi:MAG: S16 family serine protease [Candidatus Aenigmatarchaeota archaeon]
MKRLSLLLIFVFLISLIILNFFTISFIPTKTETITITPAEKNLSSKNVIKLKVPAIDENGNGVLTILIVEAVPGKGRVLTDIDHLIFFIDTQNSIQIAKAVAQNITGIDTSKVDLIYQIETNASAIGGPSAGAALTIATIAALENKTLNEKVGITGTINLDGSIGPVGGIEEKAKASKEAGIEIFLVPKGQGTGITYIPKRECRKIGPILFCTTEYSIKKVDVSESVGIKVKEVSNIQEALKYFLE